MSTSTIPIETATYGGYGGKSFKDSHDIEAWGQITKIIIRHGNEIDGITVTYNDGTTTTHGGNGGNQSVINLERGEYISKVEGRAGSRLDYLYFHTSRGKEYGPFGKKGGNPFDCNFGSKGLVYFFGRAGNRIDQIGFAYA